MPGKISITPYNPIQWVYVDQQRSPRYKFIDMFDDWVHHRNKQFAVQPPYLQKWEQNDTILCQFVCEGMGDLECYVFDYFGKQVDVINATTITNPTVYLPQVLRQISINPGSSTYPIGYYLLALKANNQWLAVSEWQSFNEVHEGTYLIEYYGNINKEQTYWNSFRPMLRVEAAWYPERGDGSSVDYNDEYTSQPLSFQTFTTKKIRFGGHYGIPDWMQIKLNRFLRLNNVSIEGTRFTLPSDSKWESSDPSGYPLYFWEITLRRFNQDMSMDINDDGTIAPPHSLYLFNAESIGRAPGVIKVEQEVH